MHQRSNNKGLLEKKQKKRRRKKNQILQCVISGATNQAQKECQKIRSGKGCMTPLVSLDFLASILVWMSPCCPGNGNGTDVLFWDLSGAKAHSAFMDMAKEQGRTGLIGFETIALGQQSDLGGAISVGFGNSRVCIRRLSYSSQSILINHTFTITLSSFFVPAPGLVYPSLLTFVVVSHSFHSLAFFFLCCRFSLHPLSF